MSAEVSVEYSPQEVDVSTLEAHIKEGYDIMPDGGEMRVNLHHLEKGSTVIICFILALTRRANQCNCRLTITNISPNLRKLLSLYQISEWWPPAAKGGGT